MSGHTDERDISAEQMLELLRENERLRADLILANQRIIALEARISRMKRRFG